MKRLIRGLLLMLLALLIYNFFQLKFFKLVRVRLETNKTGQGIRISQISDYHNNRLINTRALAARLAEFDPHIIVLTGDMVDRRSQDFTRLEELLGDLAGLDKKIYMVLGNHELSQPRLDQVLEILARHGVRLLDRELVREGDFNIMGLAYRPVQAYGDLAWPDSRGAYSILLCHDPAATNYLDLEDVDLVLSGHTHGGQVRLPFLGAILAPGQGFFPRLDKGLYNISGCQVYVDSGLGTSLLPLRFLNRVQLSNISIN